MMKDEKGCWFGSKSATLEAVGLLLPLIVFPEFVTGKQLVFKVDNIAVMWGWNTGYVRNDQNSIGSPEGSQVPSRVPRGLNLCGARGQDDQWHGKPG